MKSSRIILAVAILSLAGQLALAGPPVKRTTFSLGPWMGTFSQSAYGHDVKFTGYPSIGFQGAAGIQAGPIFVEYDLALFLPQYWWFAAREYALPRDMSYLSLVGLNLGWQILSVAECFVGYEMANFARYWRGVGSVYDGPTVRVGAAFIGLEKLGAPLHFVAEYRRMWNYRDSGGRLPESVGGVFQMFYAGLRWNTASTIGQIVDKKK